MSVVVIDGDEPQQFRKKDEPFFVGGYDPGTMCGAVVRVNLADGRVVEGTPVSLAELKSSGKSPDVEPTADELAHCLRALAKGHDHRRYFRRVVIEKQFTRGGKGQKRNSPKLQMIAVALSTLLGSRAIMSSMRSVRSHYGISVSAKDMNARSKRAREDQAYNERKRLSLKMVEEEDESPLDDEDLGFLFALASEYWEKRAEKYNITKKGKLNDRIRKAYSDLVEASIHALFPGNWASFMEQEIKMHNVGLGKLSPQVARAHRQRAKLLLNIFGVEMNRVESRYLPIEAIRKYVAFANDDVVTQKTKQTLMDQKVGSKPVKRRPVARKKKAAPKPRQREKQLTLTSLIPGEHLW